MTFYRHFENKEQIAKVILEDLLKSRMEEYKKVMSAEIPFEKKMQEVMRQEYEAVENMSNEFVKDILSNDGDELGKYLQQLLEQYNSVFVRDLFIAQQEGHIRKDVKISFIVNVLSTLNDMMKQDSFTSMYVSTGEAIRELTQFFLYGIFPPRETNE